jgi:hypothetical protein
VEATGQFQQHLRRKRPCMGTAVGHSELSMSAISRSPPRRSARDKPIAVERRSSSTDRVKSVPPNNPAFTLPEFKGESQHGTQPNVWFEGQDVHELGGQQLQVHQQENSRTSSSEDEESIHSDELSSQSGSEMASFLEDVDFDDEF